MLIYFIFAKFLIDYNQFKFRAIETILYSIKIVYLAPNINWFISTKTFNYTNVKIFLLLLLIYYLFFENIFILSFLVRYS